MSDTDWVDLGEITEEVLLASKNGARPEASGVSWLDEYELRQAEYVDRPLLQASTFHLLGGRPGVGKGAICAYWVARCSNGTLYPEPRRVLWLSSEDDPSIDLGPRIEAAGGDRSLIGLIPHTFTLPAGADWLRDQVIAIGDVGLVIIDPISNHTGSANTDKESEVRSALMPLGVLAHELQIPILGIRHITTKEAKGGALSHILGSTAWIGVPRVVLAAVKDPAKPEVVHVHPIKGNRVPINESGRCFQLEGRMLPDFTETVVAARDTGVSQVDIDSLLAGEGATATELAADIILRLLAESGGEMESDALDAATAEQTGLAVSTLRKVRTMLRDKGAIRFTPEKDESGTVSKWRVKLTNAISDPKPRARGGTQSNALWPIAGDSGSEPTTHADSGVRSGDLQGKSTKKPQRTQSTPPRDDGFMF